MTVRPLSIGAWRAASRAFGVVKSWLCVLPLSQPGGACPVRAGRSIIAEGTVPTAIRGRCLHAPVKRGRGRQ